MDAKIANALSIAKSGGRHHGFYRAWKDKPSREIEKSMRSLRGQIETHQDKIANPDKYIAEGIPPRQRAGLINRYWPKEIENFKQELAILEGILRERTHEQAS